MALAQSNSTATIDFGAGVSGGLGSNDSIRGVDTPSTLGSLNFTLSRYDLAAIRCTTVDADKCKAHDCIGCSGLRRVVDTQASSTQRRIVLVGRPCVTPKQSDPILLADTGIPIGFIPFASPQPVTWYGGWGVMHNSACAATLAYHAWEACKRVLYIQSPYLWRIPWKQGMFDDLAVADLVVFDQFDRGAATNKQLDWVYRYALRRQMTDKQTVVRICADPPARSPLEIRRWSDLCSTCRA